MLQVPQDRTVNARARFVTVVRHRDLRSVSLFSEGRSVLVGPSVPVSTVVPTLVHLCLSPAQPDSVIPSDHVFLFS